MLKDHFLTSVIWELKKDKAQNFSFVVFLNFLFGFSAFLQGYRLFRIFENQDQNGSELIDDKQSYSESLDEMLLNNSADDKTTKVHISKCERFKLLIKLYLLKVLRVVPSIFIVLFAE